MISKPISVVIPVFEEAGNIEQLCKEIETTLGSHESMEIVFVDDGSRDETASVLERLKSNKRVRVVSHQTRCGQSAALHSGVRHADCERIVTLDGDGQNDPADIPALLAAAAEHDGGDRGLLVIGNRTHRRDGWIRKFSSRVANCVRKRVLGDDTPDTGCGIKTFRRADFLELPYFDHMHRFLPALFLRNGGHVISLNVTHRPRGSGQSKYGVNDRLWSGIVDMLGVMWLMRRHPKTDRNSGAGRADAKTGAKRE
jgi:dolichol-phosphate mannosyltransferase